MHTILGVKGTIVGRCDNHSLLSVFSLGGLVLDYTVVSYDEVAVFQPVINGTCNIIHVCDVVLLGRFSPTSIKSRFSWTRFNVDRRFEPSSSHARLHHRETRISWRGSAEPW